MGRRQQGLPRNISLPYLVGTRLNPTMIRIKRQERSYLRQLKSVENEINELYPSARHAYIPIGLAVKTSRPQNSMNFYSREGGNLLNLVVSFKINS